jgi:hypothetical protein
MLKEGEFVYQSKIMSSSELSTTERRE